MYKIKITSEFGRGLYATRDIGVGEIITECELLVLEELDTKVVNMTSLRDYTFKFNKTQDCLVLGDGKLFNHADFPNCEYRLVEFDGRHIMQFFATQEIITGEQLFIDYTHDEKTVLAANYTSNLVG